MSTETLINSQIEKIILEHKTIAVVGLSDKSWRASHGVAKLMQDTGYTVIPVNPMCDTVFGLKSYPSLLDIPQPFDLVDVFRRSEYVSALVDETIQIGAKAIWLQLGVIDQDAALRALDAGIDVVMDRCWAIEYRRVVR